MIVSRRDMILNGSPVVAGQVLDGIWPALRELARRNLLRLRWVEEVPAESAQAVAAASPPAPAVPRKRGRPKGSTNRRPVAPA